MTTEIGWEPVPAADSSDWYIIHGNKYIRLLGPKISAPHGKRWRIRRAGSGYCCCCCTDEDIAGGHTRAGLQAYCKRERITLPPLPEEWCPDEEPAKPDDDGWIPWGGGECPVPAGTKVQARLRNEAVATVPASSLWWNHHHNSADIIAYRIISSPEPTEKSEATTGAVQMQTTRDRLLNLADRMWFSDKPAASFAFDLRKLARELDGGDQ